MYSCYWNSILQLRNVTCHIGSHSVTFHPTQVNTPRLNPSQTGRYSIYLPRTDGRLSFDLGDLLHTEMVYPPTDGHPSISTNPAKRGRESNSQLVDHKSDALTTTLPSHLQSPQQVGNFPVCGQITELTGKHV